MKYRPEYPSKPFENIDQAQSWVDGFVFWYNTQHLHSSIRYVTPDDRHFGRESNTSWPIGEKCMKKPEVEIRIGGQNKYVIGTLCIRFG